MWREALKEDIVKARLGRVLEAGTKEGIVFKFGENGIASSPLDRPNTLDAHRLFQFMSKTLSISDQSRLLDRLFSAVFLENLDISDPQILVKIGREFDFDTYELFEFLESEQGKDTILTMEEGARTVQMVQGSPSTTFDLYLGADKAFEFAIVGSQEPQFLSQVINRSFTLLSKRMGEGISEKVTEMISSKL